MIITHIRSSFLNQYSSTCQHSAFIEYCLLLKSAPHPKTIWGSIYHLCMELIGKLRICQQKNEMSFIHEDIGEIKLSFYEELYDEKYIQELCRRAFNFYQQKYPDKIFDKDYKQIEKWVFQTLTYKNGLTDPRNKDIIACELKFDIPIDEQWANYNYPEFGIFGNVHFHGTIDQIIRQTDDIYEITDFKSGSLHNFNTGQDKDYVELMTEIQCKFYHYIIFKLFPHLKQTLFSYFYVRYLSPYTIVFDKEDIKNTEKQLKETFLEIKRNTYPKLKSKHRTHFFCKKICHFCKHSLPNSPLCICEEIQNSIQENGMVNTIKKYKCSKFNFGDYVQS
jgi:hypothetical protein